MGKVSRWLGEGTSYFAPCLHPSAPSEPAKASKGVRKNSDLYRGSWKIALGELRRLAVSNLFFK